jgi:putative flippase GtrA
MFAIKYFGAQIVSFLFDFLLFTILSLTGNSIFISNFFAKIASGLLGFLLQRHFVFRASRNGASRQFLLYLALWISNIFGTSWLVVQIDAAIENRYLAKLLTDGLAFVINYLVSRYIIFSKPGQRH